MNKKSIFLLVLIVSLFLAVSSISAADAASDNLTSSSDDVSVYHEDNSSKDIYVTPSGDDSSSGSNTSPLKTINASVSKFNASDNGVIHLSEGVFSGDGNNMIEINYAHKLYNGSLTFIGAGYNKTIIDGGIDGNASYKFFTLGADTRITFINLTFVNGKDNNGGAITSGGDLTIDSCIFDSCNAPTDGGAIYINQNDASTTIRNSTFSNLSALKYGGALNLRGKVDISDSKFADCYTTYTYGGYGGMIYYEGTNLTFNLFDCEFYNGSAGYGGAVYFYGSKNSKFNATGNKFINCTATQNNYNAAGNALFLSGSNNIYLYNNTVVSDSTNAPFYISYNTYVNNLNVNFMDNQTVNISSTNFELIATVTDDMGNLISGGSITFLLDNNPVISYSTLLSKDGYAKLNVTRLLDNGLHIVNGTYQFSNNENVKINGGTINFYINRNPVDIYVSPEGDDENGDGTADNPFKSLSKAVTYGFQNSLYPIIHMDNGTYLSVNNTNINTPSFGSLKIIGKSYNSTIIDAEYRGGFITAGQHMSVDITNITFVNSTGYGIYTQNSDDSITLISDCIFENFNNGPLSVYRAKINNVIVINGSSSQIVLSSINNSKFIGNKAQALTLGTASNITNTEFINNSKGAVIIRPSIIALKEGNNFLIKNCTFINNTGSVNGSAISFRPYGDSINGNRSCTIEDCLFVNNTASDYGGAVALDDNINYTIKNNRFINNTANYGGAIAVGYNYTAYYFIVLNYSMNIINNTMDDNHGIINGNEIYIVSNSMYTNVKFNDLTTSKISDNITAEVTDDMGNTVSGGFVYFCINNIFVGQAPVVNGTAVFNFIGFENGTYVLNGSYSAADKSTIKNGNINVGIENIVSNITYYVSPSGSDENGTGTLDNPFRTIKHAYDEGVTRTTNLKIELLEGNFTGEGNINLVFSGYINLTINGKGINITNIDGTPIDNVSQESFIVGVGSGNFVFSNLTLANGVVKHSFSRQHQNDYWANNFIISEGIKAYMENVYFTKNNGNGGGALSNYGDLTLINCDFFNNGDSSNASAIDNYGTLNIMNSSFILNHAHYSTITNNGNMSITSSEFIDDLATDHSSNGYFYRIRNNGFATFEDTQFIVSGKSQSQILDIIGRNNIWHDGTGYQQLDNPLCSNCFSNSGTMVFENCTFTDNPGVVKYYGSKTGWGVNTRYCSPNDYVVFDGNTTVVNSTFNNIQTLQLQSSTNSQKSGYISITGSVFNNMGPITAISYNRNFTDYFILNDNVMLFKNNVPISLNNFYQKASLNMDNNWFGTNTPQFTKYNVTKYLVLAVEPVSEGELSQKFKFGFKVFDSENYTDYEGGIPARSFEFVTSEGIINLTGNHRFNIDYADGAAVNTVSGDGLSSVKDGIFTTASYGNKTFRLTVDNETLEYNTTFRKTSQFNLNPKVLYVGNNTVTITLTDSEGNPIAGDITVLINDSEYEISVRDGKIEFEPDEFKTAGVYEIVLKYNGTEEYLPAEFTGDVTVLVGSSLTFSADNKGNVYVNLTDSEGNPIANSTVRYTVNGTEGTIVTGDDGTGVISGLRGKYDLSLAYDGNGNYAPSELVSSVFVVTERINTTIESHDFSQTAVDMGNGERGGYFTVRLTDADGNPLAGKLVWIGFNGKVYNRTTDANGSARLQINLRTAGDYTFATSFLGDDDYAGSFVVNTIRISKKVSRLVLSGNSAVKVNAYRTLTISLQGQRALNHNSYITAANKTVSVTVNGRTYSVRIGPNKKGTLRVRFTRAGTYTITTKFAGDGTYSAKTLTSKITVRR